MATYKTKAIILTSYPYREHDRVITFFSGEFGKIDARARGLRKITSKLAGHLESFIETELLLANGRRWDILAGSRTLNPRMRLRSDVDKLAAASVCVEAVKHITKPLSSDLKIFGLLSDILDRIENFGDQKEHECLVSSFLWNLLLVSGFGPELERCIHCRETVFSGSFSFEGGGMLCDNCGGRDIFSQDIDEASLAQLRSGNLRSRSAQKAASGFWDTIIDHHPLNSLNFFSEIWRKT